MPAASSGSWRSRSSRPGSSPSSSRPTSASSCCRTSRSATITIRMRVYETRVYRILRGMIQWCVDHRIKVVAATVGVFALSNSRLRSRAATVLSAVGTARTVLQLRLPEGTAVQRHRAVDQGGGSLVEGRPGHRDLHRLYRPGLAALLARPQPATAERSLSPRSSSSPRASVRASASRPYRAAVHDGALD